MCGANKSGLEGMARGAIEKTDGNQANDTQQRLDSGDRLFSLGYHWAKSTDWQKSGPGDLGSRQMGGASNTRSLLR